MNLYCVIELENFIVFKVKILSNHKVSNSTFCEKINRFKTETKESSSNFI